MIIINCKDFYNIHKRIYCNNNDYISSIEYIDNEFDEIIIKKKDSYNNLFCYNIKFEFHNPVGPAYETFYNNKIQKQYWLNNIPYKEKEFEKAVNDYRKL